MTAGEIESRMSSREMAHWFALYRIERRDRDENDVRADLDGRAAAAVNRIKRRR